MNEENQLYQLSCHFSPLLDQGQLEGMVQNLKNILKTNEGMVLMKEELSANNIQRKKLAYPIQKYQESFYLMFNFLANSQAVSQINNQLNLDKNVLRHMIVAKEKQSSAPKEIIDYKVTEQIEILARKQKKLKAKKEEIKENPKKESKPESPAPVQKEEVKKEAVEELIEKKVVEDKSREEKAKIEELDKKLDEILKY